ncbi:MAG: hypothetical protein M9894_20615 [Planctomycetes bacterium]|nr:hypothetical protein [Planctomycetota bacterium]
MEDGPFSAPEFPAFAAEVELFADLGVGRDAGLMRRLGGDAVPYLVFLAPDGRALGAHRGPLTVAALERSRAAAEVLRALPGDDGLAVEQQARRLIAQVELGLLTRAQAEARRDALVGLEGAARDALTARVVDAEVLRLWYDRQPRTLAERVALGRVYGAMFRSGDRPARREAAEAFYLLALDAAEAARSASEFAALLEALTAWGTAAGVSPTTFAPFQARLERLRGAGRR